MVAVSMLTNTVIMGFSSEQLAEWLPWMYETIEGDQYIKLGYGRYVDNTVDPLFLQVMNQAGIVIVV